MAGCRRVIAGLLLFINFCMNAIILGISCWAVNKAINHSSTIGSGLGFSLIYFPMGNAATGFFVLFGLISGVIGVDSAFSGLLHICCWNELSMLVAKSAAYHTWRWTLIAMGFACKEIELHVRDVRLRTMEVCIIILSATQFFYIVAIGELPVGEPEIYNS